MANRNTNSIFSHTPTISFPRTRFKSDTIKKIQSQRHGFLTPFFIDIVYPGDSWNDKANIFCRMDKSARVPLDDIFCDIYYFYVPFRILDKNFEKILGAKDPYDTNTYGFPVTSVVIDEDVNPFVAMENGVSTATKSLAMDFLPMYLNYQMPSGFAEASGVPFMSYPMAAYYKIYNDFFRDENLDDSIPIEDLYGGSLDISGETTYDIMSVLPDDVLETLKLLPVNKYHDLATSGLVSPSKGPNVTIPLGVSAPIIAEATSHDMGYGIRFGAPQSGTSGMDFANIALGLNGAPTSGVTGNVLYALTPNGGDELSAVIGERSSYIAANTISRSNLIADLTNATAASINQFALALKIEQLYQRRAVYGTRLTEVYRGQWGINVPDDILDRPEYLGGINTDLNNIPVLGTAADNLAEMSGMSSTLFSDNGYYKAFFEFGVIIGLSVTRVKHIYAQGRMTRLWDLRTDLDLYNPLFANIGPQPFKVANIYNGTPQDLGTSQPFNYQEAWSDLRTGLSGVAGIFSSISGDDFAEFRTLWTYADYYDSKPQFSSLWLKEDPMNVARTLTGQLIPYANTRGGHQFIFAYYNHPVMTRELPARSELKLTTRY